MVQLWVNLPKALKMSPPRYQTLSKDKIPVVNLPDVTEAGLLAGEELYNQVVFEPVTMQASQNITFFWEIDFPFGQ